MVERGKGEVSRKLQLLEKLRMETSRTSQPDFQEKVGGVTGTAMLLGKGTVAAASGRGEKKGRRRRAGGVGSAGVHGSGLGCGPLVVAGQEGASGLEVGLGNGASTGLRAGVEEAGVGLLKDQGGKVGLGREVGLGGEVEVGLGRGGKKVGRKVVGRKAGAGRADLSSEPGLRVQTATACGLCPTAASSSGLGKSSARRGRSAKGSLRQGSASSTEGGGAGGRVGTGEVDGRGGRRGGGRRIRKGRRLFPRIAHWIDVLQRSGGWGGKPSEMELEAAAVIKRRREAVRGVLLENGERSSVAEAERVSSSSWVFRNAVGAPEERVECSEEESVPRRVVEVGEAVGFVFAHSEVGEGSMIRSGGVEAVL